MIGDDDEAFPRHTQDSERERVVVRGRRGLKEVPWSRNCQKRQRRKARGGPPEGLISKTALNEPGDGISVPKSGSRAHTLRHVKLSLWEKIDTWWSMGDCLLEGFPLTGRSTLCTLESEVSDRRRAYRKSWLEKVTDDEEIRQR